MGLLSSFHDAEIDLFRTMNLAGSNDALDSIMLLFTFLGISYVIIFVWLPLWLQGRKDAAFDVLILVVLATAAAEILKLIVDRSRPSLELDDVNTIVSASGPSFPSAHATRAFAVACLIWIVEPRRYGVVAVIVASLIAVSRVYIGVHWPTDVLAGAVLGVAIAVVFMNFTKHSVRYQRVRKKIIDTFGRG